jgi:hypothetical protein
LIVTLGVVLEVIPDGWLYLDHNNMRISRSRAGQLPQCQIPMLRGEQRLVEECPSPASRTLVWHALRAGRAANTPS